MGNLGANPQTARALPLRHGGDAKGSPEGVMQSTSTQDIRIEIVTTSFVAAGKPAGISDLGRLLENFNNPSIARHIELSAATVRPLYRAASPLAVDSTLLVRRDEIVFATFEGPQDDRAADGSLTDTPCLMLAPPFQIQGDVPLQTRAHRAQALRALTAGFFQVRDARVYDAEGYLLGEGQQIIVNGTAVQMAAPTRKHIEAFVEKAGAARRASVREPSVEPVMVEDEALIRAA